MLEKGTAFHPMCQTNFHMLSQNLIWRPNFIHRERTLRTKWVAVPSFRKCQMNISKVVPHLNNQETPGNPKKNKAHAKKWAANLRLLKHRDGTLDTEPKWKNGQHFLSSQAFDCWIETGPIVEEDKWTIISPVWSKKLNQRWQENWQHCPFFVLKPKMDSRTGGRNRDKIMDSICCCYKPQDTEIGQRQKRTAFASVTSLKIQKSASKKRTAFSPWTSNLLKE